MRKSRSSIKAIIPAVLPAVLGAQATALGADHSIALSTAGCRAVVSVEPYPRVTWFSTADGPSVLVDADHRFAGVRTWFMEPTQVKHSGRPSNRKARIVEQDDRRALMEAEPDEMTHLQVLMDVQLDDEQPVLTIRHGLRNLAERPRTIAAWGIVSVPHEGVIELTSSAPGFEGQHLVYFRDTLPDHPAFDYGPDRVTVRLQAMGETAIKIGAATSDGQAAWTMGHQRLVVTAPRRKGHYPEGGANATVFASGTGGKHRWAELESVGPLTRIAPGEVVWLEQHLRIESAQHGSTQQGK